MANSWYYQAQYLDMPLYTMETKSFTNMTKTELIYEVEGLSRQLSELEKTEAELRSREAEYRILLDESSDPIFAFYPDGQYRYVNWTFANGVGKKREEIIGKKIWDVFSKEEADKRFAIVRWVFEHGESKVIEVRVPRPDGDRYYITTAKPILNDQDQVISVICISKEITARRLAEVALQELNETLEQRVQEEIAKSLAQERLMAQQSRLAAMGEMVGNIAHQWKQPLCALELILQMIGLDHKGNELTEGALEGYIADAKHVIRQMSGTIDDFRNFFKPNKEKQRFLVGDSLEQAIKLASHNFINSNIQICQEQYDEPCVSFGYPNEFAQVVLNALSNAKDVIVEKKIHGELRIQVMKGADTATVSIRDNGGGIPEEVLPKVFDPYFTTKEKGAGIGLYMSKMIMDNMGGDISIRNVEDGAEVLITLPLADTVV